ncbi:MAG: methyl-accepting chemotaxis protein [Kiritimatiellia bacterium]|jgi:methyl-accepting chemotaxis protein
MAAQTKATTTGVDIADLLEGASQATLLVGADFAITWLNDAAQDAFGLVEEQLQSSFGVDAGDVVGFSFLRFFGDMARAERVLKQKRSFPWTSDVQVGESTVSVEVNAAFSGRKVQQYLVHWDVSSDDADGAETDVLTQASVDAARIQSMVDKMPINILLADLDFNIVYANESSVRTLEGLAQYLPIPVSEVVGSSIDIFHKHPTHQRRLLADPTNLPHTARVALGPEILELQVDAIFDNDGNYTSPMVSWSLVTEQVAAEKAKKKAEAETSRIQSMVDNMPINILLADLDFNIVYVNKASLKTLEPLQRYMPIPVSEIVGTNMDVFHKRPSHQRRMVGDPANLPHTAKVRLGPETLELEVSAIYDADGNYVNAMVAWSVITEQVEVERQKRALMADAERKAKELHDKVNLLLEVVSAASSGDLTQQVTVSGEDAIGQMGEGLAGFLVVLRESMASIGQTSTSLAGAAEELTATGGALSQNVSETNEQAESLASSADHVSSNVEAVASAAEEMTASISEIAQNANKAAEVAQRAVVMAKETDDTINQLGVASNEIGEVIKVITSIAQQTNLLALNATIEAARAGEAGRGFAVVANEVKELAKETARATKDIGHKIEAIQDNTGSAVAAIRDIGLIIHQISEIQDNIASAVEEQSAVTNEISRNAVIASSSTTEISESTKVVAEAAVQSKAAVNDVQGATDELARMAIDLEHLVSKFTY